MFLNVFVRSHVWPSVLRFLSVESCWFPWGVKGQLPLQTNSSRTHDDEIDGRTFFKTRNMCFRQAPMEGHSRLLDFLCSYTEDELPNVNTLLLIKCFHQQFKINSTVSNTVWRWKQPKPCAEIPGEQRIGIIRRGSKAVVGSTVQERTCTLQLPFVWKRGGC